MPKEQRLGYCHDCKASELPAHRAILFGHKNCLRNSVATGDAKQSDARGRSILHIVSSIGDIETLRYLLDKASIDCELQCSEKLTCAMVAARHGHMECMKAILSCPLEQATKIALKRDSNGCTILHDAVQLADNDMAVWLLQRFGKIIAKTANNERILPIHIAAAQGNVEFIRIVTKYDVTMVDRADSSGATPVFYAIQSGNLDCVRYLVEKCRADLRCRTRQGHSVLHLACLTERVDTVQWLLDILGVEVAFWQNYMLSTPMHCAAYSGNTAAVKLLMDAIGDSKSMHLVRDGCGNTMLHLASLKNRQGSVKWLLSTGADPAVRNAKGETPLTIASSLRHKLLYEMLALSIKERKTKSITRWLFRSKSRDRRRSVIENMQGTIKWGSVPALLQSASTHNTDPSSGYASLPEAKLHSVRPKAHLSRKKSKAEEHKVSHHTSTETDKILAENRISALADTAAQTDSGEEQNSATSFLTVADVHERGETPPNSNNADGVQRFWSSIGKLTIAIPSENVGETQL